MVAVADREHADNRAVAVAGPDVADAATAAPLPAVAHRRTVFGSLFLAFALSRFRLRRLLDHLGTLGRLFAFRLLAHGVGAERRPLAVAVFAHRQEEAVGVGNHQ